MIDKKIVKRIEAIRKDVVETGVAADELVTELREIREEVKAMDQYPLVVRALRLVADYIEAKDTFDIQFLEDSEDPGENLDYYLQLLEHPENEYNRDELKELTDLLKEVTA
jgi:hypothetical protein